MTIEPSEAIKAWIGNTGLLPVVGRRQVPRLQFNHIVLVHRNVDLADTGPEILHTAMQKRRRSCVGDDCPVHGDVERESPPAVIVAVPRTWRVYYARWT